MFKPYKYVKENTSKAGSDSKGGNTWELKIYIEPLGIGFKKVVSTVLVLSGLFLLATQVLWPWIKTPPARKPLLTPLAPQVLATDKIKPWRKFVNFEFSELKNELRQEQESEVGEVLPPIFYLTIPKLGIQRAEVETNSRNLSPDKRLGHYPGSALPGEVGNTFIYGHSASPMFYDPQNYRTIFSTLDELEVGDEVIVEFGKDYFKYVVEKMIVLNPEDVRPLEPISPSFLRQSYLTLMTCVPPGIQTKRLLVQARLVL